jgi:hypothetical protein
MILLEVRPFFVYISRAHTQHDSRTTISYKPPWWTNLQSVQLSLISLTLRSYHII